MKETHMRLTSDARRHVSSSKLIGFCHAFAVVVLLFVTETRASTLTYANRAAWAAAAGSFITEDFEAVPVETLPASGGDIVTPNFTIHVDENAGNLGIFGNGVVNGTREFAGDVHGPDAGPPNFNTFEFYLPITSFALDLKELDEGGLTQVLIAGSQFSIPNGSSFFGVISTVPFTTVELRNTASLEELFEADNISFTRAPEPAGFWMSPLLWSMAAMVLRSKRTVAC
jgi:hypothetical protein